MRCILLTCLCRSLYSVLLASVISFSVICVLWQRCGWQAFTWVMAAGDFVYLLPGLACGIAWDTRYIRFAPSGDTGISYFPVILCAVRKRLCEKDYIISLNLPQMGIRKQRYMIILWWLWSSWVCSFRYYYGGVHESSWWRGEAG